ncbi:response regulator transcription factor [Nakamurella deserti]|uniref:response regulator transcription factor n=1 Tax=Nakamurella deserti TaxID=2164074 RepID=UPI000DBEA343|nr:response regulator transcription factor [Nakamurella deserti]
MTSTAAPVRPGPAVAVAEPTTRVLLVDDRPLVRVGLMSILEGSRAEVRAVGSLTDALTAVAAAPAGGYRTIVVAAHLIDATTWCRLADAAPGVALVALGGDRRTDPACARFAPLPENAASPAIRAALTATARSSCPSRRGCALRDETTDCTPQELRILRLIGDGLSNREIAARLGIAEKTVKNYITGLFAKLGVSRRTHAAAIAWRLHGIGTAPAAPPPA